MRDDEHGHAEFAVSRLQRTEHRCCRGAVKLSRRLVGEQDVRRVRQRDRDGDPLLLAAGHLVGPPPCAVRDVEQAEQFAGPGPPPGTPSAREPQRQLDVLQGRQVRQQVARRLLPDEPDDGPPVAEPLPRGHRRQIVPGHAYAARRWGVEPREDVHQRGLAAARRADQGGQLTGLDDKIKPLQRLHLDALGGVDAHEPVAHDQRAGPVVLVPTGDRRGERADAGW